MKSNKKAMRAQTMEFFKELEHCHRQLSSWLFDLEQLKSVEVLTAMLRFCPGPQHIENCLDIIPKICIDPECDMNGLGVCKENMRKLHTLTILSYRWLCQLKFVIAVHMMDTMPELKILERTYKLLDNPELKKEMANG